MRRLVIAILTSLGVAALLSPGALAAGTVTVQGASPALSSSTATGPAPSSSAVEFDVGLNPADLSGLEALVRAVSDPASPSYRHFLTAAEWEQRFSPTAKEVKLVESWLRQQGIAVEGVTPDRLTIEASATAATVERAFSTKLGQYRRAGRLLRLASKPLAVPSTIAGLIAGVTGVDEILATPDHVGASTKPAKKSGKEEIPQPEGFRNAPPCSTYYGQLADLVDPSFGGGFPEPLPYAVCGYVPAQLQGAYGLTSQVQSGVDGSGVTVAIVDAYASPTLYADAHRYSELNQPARPLGAGQFSEMLSSKYNQTELCEASGWYGEQTLDVEAVHAMAPGAKILYVGAKNCLNGLYKAVEEAVDLKEPPSVISDSWGDNGGDLLDAAGTRRSFDHILMMAVTRGVGVQFSAGDEGDEFANLGMTVADYPPSSPYQTAVGGTSLQVNAADERIGELGWSTSKSVLCTAELAGAGYPGCKRGSIGKWLPKAPGAYDYGGGGGTSYEYPEPSYQEGVVPATLAERNSRLTGIRNRVEPDISMDADPTTGMLVGETQTFPDGVYYDQYRIGGTSLASPLFAGVMADADQAAGGPLGFVNPLLYKLDATAAPGAFYDVLPAAAQADVRNDYLNGVSAEEGTITSVRTLDYQGREEYCSGTGNCTKQKVAIETAPGFDSMTGIGTPGSGLIADLAAKP